MEGALAPDPLAETSARSKGEAANTLPAMRSRGGKARSWQDEVRDRVRSRRRKRVGSGELPLFDEAEAAPSDPEPAPVLPESPAAPPAVAATEVEPARFVDARASHPRFGVSPPGFESRVLERVDPLDSLADLPLQDAGPAPAGRLDPPPAASEAADPSAEPEGDSPDATTDDRPWSLDDQPEPAPRAATEVVRPVERPAQALERAQAAAVDALLLGILAAVVIYFTGRVAHVGAEGLRPSWPYLAAFLGFLGLSYAVYFTGTTGQTLGKMVYGLRVVDPGGRPPGYLNASARAALGALGVVAAGLGLLPVLFDPARRAFHDRVLHTRVVKG